MFRYLLISGIVLVSLMTFQLYEVSYNSNDVRNNINLLKAEIIKEKEKINNLKVELAYAKRPENIQSLNNNLLGLKPQKIDQFINIDQLPDAYIKPLPEQDTLSLDDQQIVDPIGALSAEVIKQN